jgi:hypothetical protein
MELDNDVINHLLFHKALIDETNDMTRINILNWRKQLLPGSLPLLRIHLTDQCISRLIWC